MGLPGNLLEGKNIVLIFEKASTRTRCAFETAAFDEGARVTFLTNSQMGKKESLEDTAPGTGPVLRRHRNSGDSIRKPWKPWRNTLGFPYGTA